MQEQSAVAQMWIEQQEEFEVFGSVNAAIGTNHSITSPNRAIELVDFHRIINHMNPKICHCFMKCCPSAVTAAGTSASGSRATLNEALDLLKYQQHAVPATVSIQQQPRNPQVCIMIPYIEGGIIEFLDEYIWVIILSLEPIVHQLFHLLSFLLLWSEGLSWRFIV
jgi:hypothetical protein